MLWLRNPAVENGEVYPIILVGFQHISTILLVVPDFTSGFGASSLVPGQVSWTYQLRTWRNDAFLSAMVAGRYIRSPLAESCGTVNPEIAIVNEKKPFTKSIFGVS